MKRASAEAVLNQIKEFLKWIPEDSILAEWNRAALAMAEIDPNDIPYVAAALAIPCDGIWSDDPDMKTQSIVQCWTTKELVVALKEEGLDF